MSKKIYRTIDLFAGIGGIRLGFDKAKGFKSVYANDFEEKCKLTYDLNFDAPKLHVEDIRKVKSDEIPDFDILLAGFPCQAFSIAGYRQGFNDDKGRGNLYFEIERILRDHQPTGFLLENVKNLEKHDNGNTFKVIIKSLEDLGYHVKPKVLNTMEYGDIPQNRERIYIVGFKDKKILERFSFPRRKTLTKKIKDLLDKEVPEKYQYNNKSLYPRIKDDVKREDTVYQWRRKYVRENKNNVFPTLTANMGMGGHNVPIVKQGNIIRKITPRECARVQGFPDDYKLPDIADSHLYKQFGNSVSVTVIERIAKNMYKALEA
jgi:DNA (cytosine-5)-methyltransferase 1